MCVCVYQPFCTSRKKGAKVNFSAKFNSVEFRVFLLLDRWPPKEWITLFSLLFTQSWNKKSLISILTECISSMWNASSLIQNLDSWVYYANSTPSPLSLSSSLFLSLSLIYIYTYIYISLNMIDIFCLDIFLLILSYCHIDFMIFGGNCLMYLT